MYLEELVIDGFKSYSSRTVIPGWDPAFNAITGLNGSGKSNILDAICFVLGISTLSHVRAANLQDLVYKRGQAGVIRASVSITFNNEDKDRSPIGYQEHDHINITRSIVINGRNKTKVNGVDKSQQDVASLFQSVQLNVNNPHFLIMQGKITKVLNMKPPEILAMVEEAAGTRMFEDHKDKAIKTIDKKDSKLSEITSLLETEIAPKLDKLREGKRALLEYQKVDVDLSLVKRFVVAYDYYHAKQRAEKTSESLAYSQERIAHLEKLNAHEAENIGLIEESLRQCHADKAKNGGKSVQLEAEVKSIADDLVKVSTQHNLALESVKDEKKSRLALQESLAENQAAVVASRKKEEKLADKFQSTIVQNDELVVNVRKLEELLQTLTTGLSSSHGKDSGYLDQLRESKEQLSSATSEAQQIQLRMAHLSKELQDAEPKARAAEKQNVGLVHDLEANTKVLALLNDQMAAVAFDAAEEARLLDARRSEMEQLDAVDQAIRELQSSQSGFQFTYSDPTPNFDRSKVKGLVAELFDISADRMDASTALEVCAGGRLYNVVVESEVVGSQLLQRGNLKHRVTIIPINKIKAFKVQAECIANAKRLAPGSVDLALSLVGYPQELAVVMDYVFGSTLLCKDPATAKLVAFDNGVRMRSVTLDGDLYEPNGQLTGGSRSSSAGALLEMQHLKALRAQRQEIVARLDQISADLNDLLRTKDIAMGLKHQIELKTHEKKMLEERMANNPSMLIVKHAADLKTEIQTLQEKLAAAKKRMAESEKQCASIEKEIKEFSSDKGSKLKSIRDQIEAGKKQIAKAQPSVQKMQEEVDLAKEETEQLQREATQIQEQMVAADQQIETLAAQIRTLEEERKAVQSRLDAANERWNRERATVVAYDNTMSQLEEEKRKKTQTIEDGKHELQKLRHEVGKLAAERDHAVRLARDLEAANVWISDQKQFFNEPDTEYDFSQADISERKKRLAQLSEQHASLSKSVDPQVLEKYERVEKREASLKQRLATVRKDKSKIQETISTLDELKREKLVETWTKVNRDFGLIFADLLPGNTCKLEPPEGQDITAGLEVKVSLGGKWKQSLTELSGGQRSLIALSLILSLLQFKPAPMYILDEVDSALDLSHTQNIGQLLKSRFRGSQFIVVSLKDGMFNNANVLFRTKFVDGVSKVDRTQNRAAVADARGGAGAGGSGKEFATPVGGASGRGKTVKMLASRRQSMLSELNI